MAAGRRIYPYVHKPFGQDLRLGLDTGDICLGAAVLPGAARVYKRDAGLFAAGTVGYGGGAAELFQERDAEIYC